MENSIQVKSLVKRYKDLMALNHFDIEIRKGELFSTSWTKRLWEDNRN